MAALLSSCTKSSISTNNASNPYKDTVSAAISLNGEVFPGAGYVNDTVVVHGRGFLKSKDKLAFQFSGQPVTAFSVLDDTTASLRVPALASTGYISAQVNQEYTFGPFFRVFGPMQMDTLYPSFRGGNAAIWDITQVESNKFLIVGDFTNYDNANINGGINRVARINHNGTLDRSFKYGSQTGAPSSVKVAIGLNNGKYLVGGNFSSYSSHNFVNGIARLDNNGSLDSVFVNTHSGTAIPVSALKGGVAGPVTGLQVQSDDKMLVMGNFQYYVQPNFTLVSVAGQDSSHLDSTLVNYLLRLNPDGSLDTTYNYDLVNHRGKESVNGSINASILLPGDQLLIVGNFTKYNGQPANRIARLNNDGTLDPTFNPGVGATLSIYSIAPQPDGKYIIAGVFDSYDGHPAAGVARINADGSYDPSFQVGKGSDGYVLTASVLPQGQIILAGSFRNFDGVLRNNFVVLNPDGSMNPTYNSNGGVGLGSGSFYGIRKILQLPGEHAFLGVGDLVKFDYRTCNSILRMTYQ